MAHKRKVLLLLLLLLSSSSSSLLIVDAFHVKFVGHNLKFQGVPMLYLLLVYNIDDHLQKYLRFLSTSESKIKVIHDMPLQTQREGGEIAPTHPQPRR
jgi:hypothetical protein